MNTVVCTSRANRPLPRVHTVFEHTSTAIGSNYGRFRFDATNVLTPGGSHELVVRVTNATNPDVAPLSADYPFFGDLYRGVSLQVTEPVHVDLLDYSGPTCTCVSTKSRACPPRSRSPRS